MLNKYSVFLIILIAGFSLSCRETTKEKLLIGFSSDSSAIELRGLDKASGYELKKVLQDGLGEAAELVVVMETPGEDDSVTMEKEWSGKWSFSGDHLRFEPLQSFEKGKSYRVETILGTSFADWKKVIAGGMESNLPRQVQVLQR